MKKFLNFDSVLCLSPHPDDVELSMYGTILQHPDTMFNILCCSFGTKSDVTSCVSRHEEIQNFWQQSELPNTNLFMIEDFITNKNEDEWVSLIEEDYKTILDRVDGICTTPELDAHFEHGIISHVGRALSRYRPLAVIQYKTVSTLDAWVPNLFVDIDDYYKHKLYLLSNFKSQKDNYHRKIFDAVHTNMFCAKKGIGKVEMYRIDSLYV